MLKFDNNCLLQYEQNLLSNTTKYFRHNALYVQNFTVALTS